MKKILLILLFNISISLFAQTGDSLIFNPELEYDGKRELKTEIINESKLKIKLLYEQSKDSICVSKSKLNITCCYFENTKKPKFYFKNNDGTIDDIKDPRWDILTIKDDSCYIKTDIKVKSIKKIEPFENSNAGIVDSIFGCKIKTVLVSRGCMDTQTYNLIFETRSEHLIFKDHANLLVYSNKDHSELYVLSVEWCRNKFLLYKISK